MLKTSVRVDSIEIERVQSDYSESEEEDPNMTRDG